MFGLFRKRVTQRLNTVNLSDDLEDVEMLEDVEKVFGIKIEQADIENLVTVGQLYDLVSAKLATGSHIDPVWALTCEIVRKHSFSRDPIDHETTFFVKFAKERGEVEK